VLPDEICLELQTEAVRELDPSVLQWPKTEAEQLERNSEGGKRARRPSGTPLKANALLSKVHNPYYSPGIMVKVMVARLASSSSSSS
jgi:hypothetical protein